MVDEEIKEKLYGGKIIRYDNKIYKTDIYYNIIRFYDYFSFLLDNDLGDVIFTLKLSNHTVESYNINFLNQPKIEYDDIINKLEIIEDDKVNETLIDCLKQRQLKYLLMSPTKEEKEIRENYHRTNIRKYIKAYLTTLSKEIYNYADKNIYNILIPFNKITIREITQYDKYPIINPNSDGQTRNETEYMYYIFCKEYNIKLEDIDIGTITIELLNICKRYFPMLKFTHNTTNDGIFPEIKMTYDTNINHNDIYL